MKQHIRNYVEIKNSAIDLARRTVGPLLLIEASVPNRNGLIAHAPQITAGRDFYMQNSQVVGEMHRTPTQDRIVAMWSDPYGNAWVEVRVLDEAVWAKVTDGTYTGLSWGGLALLNELENGMREVLEMEMWEISFVDIPAVPTAVFNSEDDVEEDESLIAKLVSGKVKPRVTREEARKGMLRQAQDLLSQAAALVTQSINPARGGEQTTNQEADMDLEQIKAMMDEALAPLAEMAVTVKSLTEQVKELQENATAKAEENTETERVENAVDADEEKPIALTAEAVAQIAAAVVAESNKPLLEKLEQIATQPGASQRIEDDGGTRRTKPAGPRVGPRK